MAVLGTAHCSATSKSNSKISNYICIWEDAEKSGYRRKIEVVTLFWRASFLVFSIRRVPRAFCAIPSMALD